MLAEGEFARVECVRGSEHGLWRDLLVGVRG